MSYYPGSLFLTLTYNDDNLPGGDSLVPSDLQLWIKRFRKEISPRLIKYYAVGEYGERYNRPHYHAIVYNCDKGDADIIRDTWCKGFVHVGTVTEDSINYVCGYIQKKLFGPMGKEVYGERIPPFARMSKGLGLQWVYDNAERLIEDGGVRRKGKIIRAPRYYMNKVNGNIELSRLNALTMEASEEKREVNALLSIDALEEWKREEELRHQTELDLSALHENRKGKF